jgi:hypothetical protein
MPGAGVSLRDVQIVARHADPKTTMRYNRARKNLDRHPNYILAVDMAPVHRASDGPKRTTPPMSRRVLRLGRVLPIM